MNEQLAPLVTQLKERRALTHQEKLKSLDIRDEIWRKYVELNKGSALDATAAQRTGLCQEMCCERERITREFQHLFKSYELDQDTKSLNYSLMVTEYSRASADQAMPTPYDLRSGPALLRTMNYLITNIVDQFDQERGQGDWYNFLWDRLRAIRKELTQQHLRDEVAVEILEQCSRFHIFCTAFLSEYSRDLFDPNLNDNVLVDCLNQLRDCYLTHKRQNNMQPLRNIAEFSSYMLLINLKEDNETLLRIRHLIQDITEVSEVKVAINISRSLLLHNTTKFFSLIENDATLLQSCLLHRYFNVIRIKRLNSLILSARNNDELRISDVTDILGMDNDDETKDYLDQLGYSISNTNPPCLILQSVDNINQQPINKLSQKLIKSKYKGNLKDIITGQRNFPIVIADTNVENSFDSQGCYIGRLPIDMDKFATTISRRPAVATVVPEQTQQSQSSMFSRRQPSESALRSIAATTTANTFVLKNSKLTTQDLFSTVIASRPKATPLQPPPAASLRTASQTTSRFEGFNQNFTINHSTTTSNIFMPQVLPKTLATTQSPLLPTFRLSFTTEQQLSRIVGSSPIPTSVQEIRPLVPIPKSIPSVIQPTPQPPEPSPRIRRLSTNSMDELVDEIYKQMIDPIIRDTAGSILQDLISAWNNRAYQSMTILNEFLSDEIFYVVNEYYKDIELFQKMLKDTLNEQYERKRKKYLSKKFFSIWLENSIKANEERLILNELQMKYHFLNNEQLLEFLTGVQLITEHNLSIEQASDIFRYRRYLKRNHSKKLDILSNEFFEEFLQEEFHSIVIESNNEVKLRQQLLENALRTQESFKREHYLQLKYFSLWLLKFRQRRKLHKQQQQQLLLNNNHNNKRVKQYLQLRTNKKLKENNEQYAVLKNSFDQLTTDLHQIQLFINKLNS